MNHARTTALGLAALAFSACSYPAFHYTDESSSSATSSSSSSGGGGMDGGSSSSASSGGAGGGGITMCTTVMHPGGGSCDYTLGNECGCPANQKCSIDDVKTGHTTCIGHASPLPWSTCNDDSDCDKGFWCDLWTRKVCRPICGNVGDCDAGAKCLPTSPNAYPNSFSTSIPGLKVCTAHCDPESTNPCSFGATCVYDDHDIDLQCMTSGNNALGVSCNTSPDCAKGLVCIVGFPFSTCEQWCHPADGNDNAACPASAPKCVALAIMVNYKGVTYGICSP